MTTSQSFVALRELTRELDANRGVYEAFLIRARETDEQSTIDNTNVRIISSATPAKSASWPPRLLLLAGSIVLGWGWEPASHSRAIISTAPSSPPGSCAI